MTLFFALFAMACDDASSEQPAADAHHDGAAHHGEAPVAGEAAPQAAADGTRFGSDFSVATVQPVETVLADPASFVDKTVRVEGTVVDVCEMRGCWLSLGAENGDVLRVKVRDGEMVFPMSARGLKAQVEGTVTSHTVSVEQQLESGEYHAKEAGETFDPASVTGPKTIYMLSPTGVLIAS